MQLKHKKYSIQKRCTEVIAKEPDGFSVFSFSISMMKSNIKTSHSHGQGNIHTVSAQPIHDIFRNMECIHFVLEFVHFRKDSQVFAKQNTKRKTRRLDMQSVV